MLTYDLNPNNDKFCLYEQLYLAVRSDILSGKLKTGEKLPSKRALSANLGISTITVENAYSQLEAEGYLRAVPKSGFYVNATDVFAEFSPVHGTDILPVKNEPNLSPANPKQQAQTSSLIDFTSNRNESGSFPLTLWAKLMREVLSMNPDELLTRSPGSGIDELRIAIAEHLSSFRGMKIQPDRIVVGAGTEYLYGLLVQLLGRDCIYGIENPGYRKITQIYQSQNVTMVPLPLDESGICIRELSESPVSILHLSPSHHFPTGLVTSIGRRLELLSWANESDGRYIIEDEYDSEFRLRGKPIPPLQSIDTLGKVIYMNTFSRSLSDTIRISYMVLPEELSERFHKELSFYSSTVPVFEQRTLALFLKRGYFDRHISRMRNRYRKKREILQTTLKHDAILTGYELVEADAGLHFMLLPQNGTKIDESILRKQCERAGLKVSFLSDYCSSPPFQKTGMVINYSHIPSEKLPDALHLLSEAISIRAF